MIFRVILRYCGTHSLEKSLIMNYAKNLALSQKTTIEIHHYYTKGCDNKLRHSYVISDKNESEFSRLEALKEYSDKYSKYLIKNPNLNIMFEN